MSKGVTSAISKGLIAYLKAGLPAIKAFSDDFPGPSQALQFPSITVFMRAPQLLNGMPYVVAKAPDASGKTKITKVAGIYEIKMQLDVWCENKFVRHQLLEDIMQIMNPNPATMGLNLQLPDYYGEFAHFSVLGFDFPDNEQESQRSEWRIKIDVQADVHALFESLDYVITSIENTFETPSTISDPLNGSAASVKTI